MALLAQPKRKEKYGFDPRNTNWASDDSKFGQKLLEKMGWEKGKGLGANEDGIVEHIKASYKSDTRGLGCSPRDADAWIAHQDDFNDLLKVLNENSSLDPEKVNTTNEDLQEGRKRFYGRFARGRVQTLRSTDDLDCIMGRRKTSEPATPVTQSVNNSDDEQKDTDLKTVTSSCSVQEYFAKKMKGLKSRRTASHEAGGNSKYISVTSSVALVKSDNGTETKPVYSAVCFSYNEEEKLPSTITGMSNEKGWYNVDEWAVMDAHDKIDGKKKKKKKHSRSGTEENLDCVNGDANKITKRKKRKIISETFPCEVFKVSVNESPFQLESNGIGNENEKELGNCFPIIEHRVKRKKLKNKIKEENTGKSLEEDECEEKSKRKKFKLKLANNLSDECQISENEISLPESKKEETNAEVGIPLNEYGDNALKKKRKRSKRKDMEMNDTSQRYDKSQSVSQAHEGAKSKDSRKRRKVADECVRDDCCSEETAKEWKKKKRREEKEAKSAQDFSDVKKKKKWKKETTYVTDQISEENESTQIETDYVLSENVEEQTEISDNKRKKKQKKKGKVEKTYVDDSERKREHEQDTTKSKNSVADATLPEKEKDKHNNAGMNIETKQDIDSSKKKLKKKRQEKKKRSQSRKHLNDSFPGSNFGELKGYEPMLS